MTAIDTAPEVEPSMRQEGLGKTDPQTVMNCIAVPSGPAYPTQSAYPAQGYQPQVYNPPPENPAYSGAPPNYQGPPPAYSQQPPQGHYPGPANPGYYPANPGYNPSNPRYNPSNPGYPTNPGYQAPQNQSVVIAGGIDAGARFDGIAQPNIPPPPPGCAPNATQMAAMQGQNVVMTQQKAGFWEGGSGGGYTMF